MAIDLEDWANVSKKMGEQQRPKTSVVYRTLELSDAWDKLRQDVQDQQAAKETALKQAEAALRNMGSYQHADLAKAKAHVDICHAEVLLIGNILQLITTYHAQDVTNS